MIDVESMVLTRIKKRVCSEFPNASFTSEEVRSSSEFPLVSVVETDNYTYENTIDSSSNENHAVIVFEVDAYSNKTTKKKTECKEIFALVDNEMLAIGFVRTMKNVIRDEDATVYRIKGRYTAVVSEEKIFYRR